MRKKQSATFTGDINTQLLNHLVREDGDEDLCFALYNPSDGLNRFSAIIDEVILPEDGDRQVHGNVSFNPSYFERVLLLARKKNKGIAFLHSHPCSGFQLMSKDDVKTESQLAPAVKSVTSLPLLGLTTGTDGIWSGRFWYKSSKGKRKFDKNWCESVRVNGNRLSISFNDYLLTPKIDVNAMMRTISAWGKKTQDDISRIKIGIAGLGSVGSIIAEGLARIGFADFTLIDFDLVENKNRDRSLNFQKKHVGKYKVDVVAAAIKVNGTAKKIKVNPIKESIFTEKAFKAAMDCDILFSCVDRPHPRQILNFISYAHLIPLIDGGIHVRTNKANNKIVGADWKIQTVGSNRPCLECLEQFTVPLAALDKEGKLDDPEYIKGADESIKKVLAGENVFAFSLNAASLEILQALSLLVLPEYIAKIKQQIYHFTLHDFENREISECKKNCFYKGIVGTGDNSGVIMYQEDLLEQLLKN